MRYTEFFPCSLFPVPCSLFYLPCSLFPVPCSLKPKNLYLTQLQTAINKLIISYFFGFSDNLALIISKPSWWLIE
ncbi:MAG: hypothetical protein F6J90_00090 [Moorea sp. SIOASIH]|uniref:hypothetical protein n=1 Tax=Moorena sp. SIOASIH TaxID=2607817 RepID=UPI0013BDFE13|nr:hypothetical protein [Moorena sp. SIOASIH]NEO34789.1 hypothetical protein [Moorena sp. SIOASIH]